MLAAGLLLLASCGSGADRSVSTPTSPSSPDGSRQGPGETKFYPVPPHRMDREQRREAAELEAIGYASGGDEAGDVSGLLTHRPERCQPGERFFVSGHAPTAILMAADGRELHEWGCAAHEVFDEERLKGAHGKTPGSPGRRGLTESYWRRALLLPDGGVLAMFTNVGLVRLDRESDVLWTYPAVVHHDLERDEEEHLWVLEREAGIVEWIHAERPVLDDHVVRLSPEGERLLRVSLLECIVRSSFQEEIGARIVRVLEEKLAEERRYREENPDVFEDHPEWVAVHESKTGDVFHTNTLQWLDGRHAEGRPHFARGNVLLCVRNLGLVLAVDPRERRVVWRMPGPSREGLHDAELLDNGNILLFDNRGPLRSEGLEGFSEVVEVDPASGEVVWSFRADEEGRFHSPVGGTCQRLANGNTLITASTAGRAFEVTPAGEIVWDFLSPYRAGRDDRLVAFLPELELVRAGWLEERR